VTQSHEPSYYEIALTNRQVLIVFVVLLICVVAAFFSGVWVGKRDDVSPVMEMAQQDSEGAAATTEEGSVVEELRFFSDEEAQEEASTNLADMADQPQPDTTLLEDLGGSEPEPEAPAPAPKRQASAPAPTQQAASGETASATASGGYVIQVFSSADEVQARKLLGELTDGGYPAFLSPVEVGSQTMMRVRIGPYSQLANAETVAERLRRDFKLDTWVTR
jgi:cell division septation protein DedD